MNHLHKETSPYLLQHKDNPVDWHAWRPEAFAKARLENKPILVSVGYSTCHWCHVMERESFEDEQVAEFMNANFINIKVDREERPDVDMMLMEVCQLINGNGGWPLNCFLLPDGRPFFAGTYYPPQPVQRRPSWRMVLQRMADAFFLERAVAEKQAEQLMEHLNARDTAAEPIRDFDLSSDADWRPAFAKVYEGMKARFDTQNGGFGGAPKFPNPMNLSFLLSYGSLAHAPEPMEHAVFSLRKMIKGGIYDQLGGGFARYTVDERWMIPHFEKMLYDNALLLPLLARAWKYTADYDFMEAIQGTVDWLEREMISPDGLFFSALDADSEGVEGKFYTWTWEEFVALAGADRDWLAEYFGVVPNGNWEHTNILHRAKSLTTIAEKYGRTVADLEGRLASFRESALDHRAKRVRPGLDNKVLLDWNALMIAGLCETAVLTGESAYGRLAVRAAEQLQKKLRQEDGTYLRSFTDGRAQYPAFLSDYAFFAEATLALYTFTWDRKWLDEAQQIAEIVCAKFGDVTSPLFYFSAGNDPSVAVRMREQYDASVPSGNAVMAQVLLKLAVLFDRPEYRARGQKMLAAVESAVHRLPTAHGKWLETALFDQMGWRTIVVSGKKGPAMLKELQTLGVPGAIWLYAAENTADLPLVAHRIHEKTLIYVCENMNCQMPVESMEAFKQLVEPNKV